jgi:propanediol dehydratase small subunit
MDNIENLVSLLAKELKSGVTQKPEQAAPKASGAYTQADYPMLQKHGDVIKTPTGKSMSEINLENVLNETVTIKDVRISSEMLHAQAQIAESAGKKQIGENLKRAAELIQVPDDTIIKMYDMLRPNRSTRAQLEQLAQTLLNEYQAPMCAQLVREAAAVYEKRNILLV